MSRCIGVNRILDSTYREHRLFSSIDHRHREAPSNFKNSITHCEKTLSNLNISVGDRNDWVSPFAALTLLNQILKFRAIVTLRDSVDSRHARQQRSIYNCNKHLPPGLIALISPWYDRARWPRQNKSWNIKDLGKEYETIKSFIFFFYGKENWLALIIAPPVSVHNIIVRDLCHQLMSVSLLCHKRGSQSRSSCRSIKLPSCSQSIPLCRLWPDSFNTFRHRIRSRLIDNRLDAIGRSHATNTNALPMTIHRRNLGTYFQTGTITFRTVHVLQADATQAPRDTIPWLQYPTYLRISFSKHVRYSACKYASNFVLVFRFIRRKRRGNL